MGAWWGGGSTHNHSAADDGSHRIGERHFALTDDEDAIRRCHRPVYSDDDVSHVTRLPVGRWRQAVHLVRLTPADAIAVCIEVRRGAVGHKMSGDRAQVVCRPHVAKLMHMEPVHSRPQAAHVDGDCDIAQRLELLKQDGAVDLGVDAHGTAHLGDGAVRRLGHRQGQRE